jgi:hypothetical protein
MQGVVDIGEEAGEVIAIEWVVDGVVEVAVVLMIEVRREVNRGCVIKALTTAVGWAVRLPFCGSKFGYAFDLVKFCGIEVLFSNTVILLGDTESFAVAAETRLSNARRLRR